MRTRRYHALLCAATQPPAGRMVLVSGFEAWIDGPAGSVALTSQFTMTELTRSLDDLLAEGRRINPSLDEMRSREQAAQLAYRGAQSAYMPTLTLFSGVGGYTNQYTDQGFVLGQRTQSKRQQCLANAGSNAAAVDACDSLTLTPADP